ncbi:hypothetical protein QYE76_020782 [Lolium multiflorum]|uniref:CCHC-type domain-containing protein n=1 Tax=Lolium multiflorum TaxID=4521 RepID=A0AAD8R6W4_LOLMU|nr:hypothetical protein QYE76_020782 [Lolium multiflorum]
MAKASKVSPSLEPYISSDDEVDDMEELNVASLNKMGELVVHALHKKKFAFSKFTKILTFAIESIKLIDKMEGHEREDANEIATLSEALKEQQTTNETLEENFALKILMVKESRDRALEVAHDFRTKNVELVSAHAKLLEDFELLKSSSRAIESELIKLTESHEQFKAPNLIELPKLPSSCAIIDNACATNSTSCEASILKENVELRAQLALLTSNYEKFTCVVTNHVGEIKELEAQVSSLKKDLVKGHEGKQSLNDKDGLGFNSNNKNKSTTHKRKKGHGHVKDPAKIVCFKCKIEGQHVRSCPLKKKPHGEKKQGKRPQDGAYGLPRLEERPLPKKDQAKAPVVEKSSEKKEKRRTCYICREKGHISSFCTIGNSSNPILIDGAYSLCKDKVIFQPTTASPARPHLGRPCSPWPASTSPVVGRPSLSAAQLRASPLLCSLAARHAALAPAREGVDQREIEAVRLPPTSSSLAGSLLRCPRSRSLALLLGRNCSPFPAHPHQPILTSPSSKPFSLCCFAVVFT